MLRIIQPSLGMGTTAIVAEENRLGANATSHDNASATNQGSDLVDRSERDT
jgi:hypothetical protein